MNLNKKFPSASLWQRPKPVGKAQTAGSP